MKPLSIGVIISVAPSPEETIALVRSLEIPTIQLYHPAGLDNPEGIARLRRLIAGADIEVTSIVCDCGLVSEGSRPQGIANARAAAAFAVRMGVGRVQSHIGYVPEDPMDPVCVATVAAMRVVCDALAPSGLVFALETGQETAGCLLRLIGDVDRPNLRVNFDPANMIMYGKDNPVQALDVLYPFIDGVHCKDGAWPSQPGALGREVPLGQGDVNFVAWLEKLLTLGYRGALTIEREISGEQQQKDIQFAKRLIESVTSRFRV